MYSCAPSAHFGNIVRQNVRRPTRLCTGHVKVRAPTLQPELYVLNITQLKNKNVCIHAVVDGLKRRSL